MCFICSQILAYAQQSKEIFNYEQASLNQRMQEYKRQVDQESTRSFNGSHGSSQGDNIQSFPRSSHKAIEAVMQTAAEGKVFIKNIIFFCNHTTSVPYSLFFFFLKKGTYLIFISVADTSIV